MRKLHARAQWPARGMVGPIAVALGIAALVCLSTSGQAAAAGWSFLGWPDPDARIGGPFFVAAWPWALDGYDPQDDWFFVVPPPLAKVIMLPYRENGPDWSGPTGFYVYDARSPLPLGTSKTWPDIYLWAQNYAPPGNRVDVSFGCYDLAPSGYVATLVLDYVPESLGYTGPFEFRMEMLRSAGVLTLPVPTVTDPLQGVRMHLTVYAIPEPSALAALGLGAVGLVGAAVRRRRR